MRKPITMDRPLLKRFVCYSYAVLGCDMNNFSLSNKRLYQSSYSSTKSSIVATTPSS